MEQPRIRLKIPRERLLSMRSVDEEDEEEDDDQENDGETSSSSSEDSSVDDVEHPRREVGSIDDSEFVVIPKPEVPIIQAYSPDGVNHHPIGVKLKTSRFNGNSTLNARSDDEESITLTKKQKCGGEKRKLSPCSSPERNRSSPRRLAPLRIHLSRNGTSAAYLATPLSIPSSSLSPPIPQPPPPPERDISITDVTVGGVTVTIRECSTPKNFFGIPTTQVVVTPRPPLVPRPIVEKAEVAPPKVPTSKAVCEVPTDENSEPQTSVPAVEEPSNSQESTSDSSPSSQETSTEPSTSRPLESLTSSASHPPPPPPLKVALKKPGRRNASSRKSTKPVKKSSILSDPVPPPCTNPNFADSVYTFHGDDSPPPPPPPPTETPLLPSPSQAPSPSKSMNEHTQVVTQPPPESNKMPTPPSLLQFPSLPQIPPPWEFYFKSFGLFPQTEVLPTSSSPPMALPSTGSLFPNPFFLPSISTQHFQGYPPTLHPGQHLLAAAAAASMNPGVGGAPILEEVQPIDLSTSSRR